MDIYALQLVTNLAKIRKKKQGHTKQKEKNYI